MSPGTELKDLLSSIGIESFYECNCNQWVVEMDRWGIEGCLRNRKKIIRQLRRGVKKRGWWDLIQTGKLAIKESWFKILDPIGSIVDEAIRRAEVKSTQV